MEKYEHTMTVRDLLEVLNNPLIDPDTPIRIASDRGEQNILEASKIGKCNDGRVECPCCGAEFDSYLYDGDSVGVYGSVTVARIKNASDPKECRSLFLILSRNSVTLDN